MVVRGGIGALTPLSDLHHFSVGEQNCSSPPLCRPVCEKEVSGTEHHCAFESVYIFQLFFLYTTVSGRDNSGQL